jgi:Mn2+/Fe2+ NRAMP family transporter/CBS domain-containing protein
MRPDETADLIGHLEPDAAQVVLERLPAERRAQVLDLLRYPEDTAGGIMNNDIVVIPVRLTIEEARRKLRDWLSEPDFVYFIYVIDDESSRRLVGVLTLRDLLVARPEALVGEVMRPNLVTIFPLESASEAARRVTESGLVALPVVSRDGRLLGAVTVDSAVALIAPASTEDLYVSLLPKQRAAPPGPVVDEARVSARLRGISPGIRMTIKGRSLTLRSPRRPPSGIFRWLAILGPGVIACAAGDDAGGVTTYSQAGAQFGYDLLWVLVLITISLAVAQEMSARLGAATGRGLLDLIRERYGIGWTLFAVTVDLVANGGLIMSEFVGIGAAVELLGISKYIVVPLAAALVWYLVGGGSYHWVEKVFLLMAMVFLAYPVADILAKPDWGAVARGTFIPTIQGDPAYILLLVALPGTTITPYQQTFQQSATVEKGVARHHCGRERIDTYVGMALSNLISAAIIIATAATLHANGTTTVETPAEAAKALQPVAGDAVFAVGLLGASLLATAVLPLTTSYAISEAFGFRKGVNLDFRRARIFFGLFTALTILGAALALFPNLPVIEILVWIQVLNGSLLPVILFFIMRLINDQRLMGDLRNSRLYNVLGWVTFVLMTISVAVVIGQQLLSLIGINPFGG